MIIMHHETIPSISEGCLMLTTRTANVFEWIDDRKEKGTDHLNAHEYVIYLGSLKRVRGAYHGQYQYVQVLTLKGNIGWMNLESLRRVA